MSRMLSGMADTVRFRRIPLYIMENNNIKHPTIFGTRNETTQKRNDVFHKLMGVKINTAEFKLTYIFNLLLLSYIERGTQGKGV
jgi:hypothetical protein